MTDFNPYDNADDATVTFTVSGNDAAAIINGLALYGFIADTEGLFYRLSQSLEDQINPAPVDLSEDNGELFAYIQNFVAPSITAVVLGNVLTKLDPTV